MQTPSRNQVIPSVFPGLPKPGSTRACSRKSGCGFRRDRLLQPITGWTFPVSRTRNHSHQERGGAEPMMSEGMAFPDIGRCYKGHRAGRRSWSPAVRMAVQGADAKCFCIGQQPSQLTAPIVEEGTTGRMVRFQVDQQPIEGILLALTCRCRNWRRSPPADRRR